MSKVPLDQWVEENAPDLEIDIRTHLGVLIGETACDLAAKCLRQEDVDDTIRQIMTSIRQHIED
jgi:hypothetical protein